MGHGGWAWGMGFRILQVCTLFPLARQWDRGIFLGSFVYVILKRCQVSCVAQLEMSPHITANSLQRKSPLTDFHVRRWTGAKAA